MPAFSPEVLDQDDLDSVTRYVLELSRAHTLGGWSLCRWGPWPRDGIPTVVLPAVTFLSIYLWPYLEARVTGDRDEHDLLDRPSERPVRTAIGATVVAFYGLLLAGSDDVLAVVTDAQVVDVVWALRVAVIVLPALVGWGTYRILR